MYNFIFFYHGLLSMIAQLVLFRELAVLFYGNELFLGTFLSSWLFWVGSGSLLVGRLIKKWGNPAKYFSYDFLVLALLLPLVILSIRLSRGLFNFGEFIGPVGTILFTFIIMGLPCLLIGAQFSLASLLEPEKNALGRVYLREAQGAVLGGVLFTYLLIGRLPIFTIVLILSIISLLVSCVIKPRGLFKILLVSVIFFIFFSIEPAVNRMQWRGFKFIRQVQTRQGALSLVKMGSVKNIFSDGSLAASFPNPEKYEAGAQWPLLAIDNPKKILVIGESSLGLLSEVLKYNPQGVDFLLTDNYFLDFARPYLESKEALALNDARVKVYYADARIFLRNKAGAYDIVVVGESEASNLKINRLFTLEFYAQVKSVLIPGGILAVSVASSEEYLSGQTRVFNASVYRTLRSAFGNIAMIPGDNLVFLCSSLPVDLRKETILARLESRGISNQYFTSSYIAYKLNPDRVAGLRRLLEEDKFAEINRDFKPAAFYYFTGFWLNKFSSPAEYLIIGLIIIIFIFIIRKRKLSILASKERILIFIFGFIGVLLELIFLLGFQVISGYVYWQIGILFAAFMLGLALGSRIGINLSAWSTKNIFSLLSWLVLGLSILSFGVGLILPRLIVLGAVQNLIIFLAALVIVGGIIGAAFVSAGFLVQEEKLRTSLYASDLWGSALGAVLAGNFVIPFFGLLGALNFAGVVGLVGLVIFIKKDEAVISAKIRHQ